MPFRLPPGKVNFPPEPSTMTATRSNQRPDASKEIALIFATAHNGFCRCCGVWSLSLYNPHECGRFCGVVPPAQDSCCVVNSLLYFAVCACSAVSWNDVTNYVWSVLQHVAYQFKAHTEKLIKVI